jgi:phosphopantothenoylcysteine decarboxylase/phosphopantothenate--cysteine ligase
MTELAGRRVVVGICGGIAAYKAVEICRRLVDAGAHVVPVMTKAAEHFIGRTTVSALASEPVRTSMWEGDDPIPHTKLGQTADLIVVVPATARLVGAYAHGLSTDLLTNILIATRAPVIVCPAMHTEMWEHPAVQDNIELLRSRGTRIVEPEQGRLAGGDSGKGRLAAPDVIMAEIVDVLGGSRQTSGDLSGVKVLVTAGGTREPIDAVRVITNRSSGKQGHAVAEEAARRGAHVVLITTTDREVPSDIDVVRVESALDMHEAVQARWSDSDVLVMTAAVADFRPVRSESGKIKKDMGVPEILLEPTVDILAEAGSSKRSDQVLVGFAAETSDMVENARRKLVKKHLDLVVANDVAQPGVGFDHDTNAVTFVRAAHDLESMPLSDKRDVARRLLDIVVEMRESRS